MKFKIYGWLTTRHKKEGDFNWSFSVFPGIELSVYCDDNKKWYWTTLVFAWLIFGITFDWRKDNDNLQKK